MTRVNRPDTLLTELREIQRRLRLLEAAGSRRGAPAAAAARPLPGLATGPMALAGPSGGPVPLSPARPADWVATNSPVWEGVLRTLLPREAGAGRLVIEAVADPGTAGLIRVTVGRDPVDDRLLAASPVLARYTVDIPAGAPDVVVHARRVAGSALVRVAAFLLPRD